MGEAREKLRAYIAERNAARGRPLTPSEKLANLVYAQRLCDSCEQPIDPVWRFCAWCGWDLTGEES